MITIERVKPLNNNTIADDCNLEELLTWLYKINIGKTKETESGKDHFCIELIGNLPYITSIRIIFLEEVNYEQILEYLSPLKSNFKKITNIEKNNYDH